MPIGQDEQQHPSLELFAAHGMGCFSWFWIGCTKDYTIERAFPRLESVITHDKFFDIDIVLKWH
jgi:hypothetical protein